MPHLDSGEATRCFTADSENAAVARRFVGTVLERWQLDPLVDVASLLTSELITNAILHSRTDMELRVSRGDAGRVRVEVADRGPGRPTRRNAPAQATTGRGLGMVHTLAADWGVRPLAGGKAVWFELAPG